MATQILLERVRVPIAIFFIAFFSSCCGFIFPGNACFNRINIAGYGLLGNSKRFAKGNELVEKIANLEEWLTKNKVKDLSVKIGPSKNFQGTGLIARKPIARNAVVLNIPQGMCMSVASALESELAPYIKDFEGWTGEIGIIALHVLWELKQQARSKFAPMISLFPETIPLPLFWSDEELDVAQKSSTKGIKGFVQDVEEDFDNFQTSSIGPSPPGTFPEEIFNKHKFKWAVGIVLSRSFFVDNELRIVPVLDHVNHQDGSDYLEPEGSGMGFFGGKSVKAVAGKGYTAGDEFFVSYGPKSPAEYLEEHGFLPNNDLEQNSCVLSFGLREDDLFRDDKLDVLESKQIENPIRFEIFSHNNGEPDPEMLRFLRLVTLNTTDAFLLEAVFRNEVWGFMALPVSQANEESVGQLVVKKCQEALDNLVSTKEKDLEIVDLTSINVMHLLAKLRLGERKALEATIGWFRRDLKALDLKEYYQERRLKSLGLDKPLDDLEQMGASRSRDVDW